MDHIVTLISLSSPGVKTVTFDGGENSGLWRAVSLQGWLNTSDAGVQLAERQSGDGAHDVPVSSIRYSARTVSVGFRLFSRAPDVPGRAQVLSMLDEVRAFVHRRVTVRVRDSTFDTYCTGYVAQMSVKTDERSSAGQSVSGTVDVVCPRPEILSSVERTYQLGAKPITATSGVGVGLRYSKAGVKTGSEGLAYPLRYAEGQMPSLGTTTVLENHGSSRAYPVFTCVGPLPHGVRLTFGGGLVLECSQPVGGVPLVLDSRSRTAQVGGLDVSRTLKHRGFPVVEPGSSLGVFLSADGDGWVTCSIRDTYM